MWIHEHQDWPNFTWDAHIIASKLAETRYLQGQALGRMQTLGFESKREASAGNLINDILKSSAIEGETLNRSEVRSFIARRLGIADDFAPVSRDVEGIVELTLDATQQFSKPLTKERLFDWHAALFPAGRSGMRRITVGGWRPLDSGPMQVVSGPIGHERVHFEAPSPDRVDKEMLGFLDWFGNGDGVDPVLKAGIAHLWFELIHPFEDGNGRIGRAILDMALARAEGVEYRFYSMSSQIQADRKNYYAQLENQGQGGLDITRWLEWFLGCLAQAISSSENTIENALFKARLWDRINLNPVSERQRLIINRMLEEDFEGFMSTSKYAKIAKCSGDTALRDIQALRERGVFIQNPGGGRKTSYRLADQV